MDLEYFVHFLVENTSSQYMGTYYRSVVLSCLSVPSNLPKTNDFFKDFSLASKESQNKINQLVV